MAEQTGRTRRVKQEKVERRAGTGDSRRRLTKFDGRLAEYAATKSSSGIVIPEVKKVLLNRKKRGTNTDTHRTNIIYPSEMARADWCPRATYYRMSGRSDPQSTSSFALENVFAEGNAIHSKWQGWLADSGLLWGDWRCSRCSEYVRDSLRPDDSSFGPCVGTGWVNLKTDPKALGIFPHEWKYKEVTLSSNTHPISGHADGALINHNCLIEIKSMGVGTFRFEAPKLVEEHIKQIWVPGRSGSGPEILDIEGMWKDLHHPLFSHVKQGNTYLWMAQQMGLPFDSIVFLYEFKANQKVKEFQIKYSHDIMKPLLDSADKIVYALEIGEPPPCPFGGCGQCRAYEKEEPS